MSSAEVRQHLINSLNLDLYPYETEETPEEKTTELTLEEKESRLQTPNDWRRIPKHATVTVDLANIEAKKTIPVPNSNGLEAGYSYGHMQKHWGFPVLPLLI